MNKYYDLTFIGAGPATIFAILKLIDLNYKGKICIIEKGKSLETRDKNELISGWAGSGCFSDSKLSSAIDVGGIIPGLTDNELNKYEDYILNKLNIFKKLTSTKTPLKWGDSNLFNTSNSTLN